MQNIKNRIVKHKKASILILILLAGLIYLIFKFTHPTVVTSSYILSQVQKGTIVSTVTGTGQVSALDQMDITPKVSGTITSTMVSPGDYVGAGQTLFTIDSTAAQKKVRDAELDLQTTLATTQYQNQNNSSQAQNDATAVANAYTNLLNSTFDVTPMDNFTSGYTKPTITGNYILNKEGIITLKTYSAMSGVILSIQGLVNDTTTVNALNTIPLGKSGLFITFPSSLVAGMNWTISIPNTNASNYRANKISYDQALSTQAANQITDPSTQLNIEAKRNALDDAKQALLDYSVKAPFSGIVATVPVKTGDQVSTSTALSTIITKQLIAIIPFNEVDIAKIKVGQKVTATFDAIEGLEMTGHVLSIDQIGTVTSGIVNYNVKIVFDTSDSRIKPGMSTNASIATAVAQDVITVPTSAIKSSNGNYYVQVAPKGQTATTGNTGVLLAEPPQEVQVTEGISDDLNTEILSGLSTDDVIVTKTITNTTKTSAAAPSIFGSVGGARGGGGAIRALGR
ncbi:MAG: efflux RND transporter periplasmic adaptor subunit [Patescibacteria group bacterium]|nr:efflux RND transporter periplasmic adaptor subunit [Patescibacteria group bacterium]